MSATTNGHAPDTATLREQIEQQRLVGELAHLKAEAAQARLLENAWGGFGGWGWGDGFDPQLRHAGLGTATDLIAGGKQGHVGGRNLPFIWTEVHRDLARGQARWLTTENMIAQGALNKLERYTVRTGFTYEGRPRKAYTKDANTAAECARIMQQAPTMTPSNLNSWPQRESEIVRYSIQDGEGSVPLLRPGRRG